MLMDFLSLSNPAVPVVSAIATFGVSVIILMVIDKLNYYVKTKDVDERISNIIDKKLNAYVEIKNIDQKMRDIVRDEAITKELFEKHKGACNRESEMVHQEIYSTIRRELSSSISTLKHEVNDSVFRVESNIKADLSSMGAKLDKVYDLLINRKDR